MNKKEFEILLKQTNAFLAGYLDLALAIGLKEYTWLTEKQQEELRKYILMILGNA